MPSTTAWRQFVDARMRSRNGTGRALGGSYIALSVVVPSGAPCLLDGEDAQAEGGPEAPDEQRKLDCPAEPDRPKRREDERDGRGVPDLHANAIGKGRPGLERDMLQRRNRRVVTVAARRGAGVPAGASTELRSASTNHRRAQSGASRLRPSRHYGAGAVRLAETQCHSPLDAVPGCARLCEVAGRVGDGLLVLRECDFGSDRGTEAVRVGRA
jgi:hypothetical protein